MSISITPIRKMAGEGLSSTLVSFCEKNKDKKILLLSYNREMGDLYSTILFNYEKQIEIKTIFALALEYFQDFKTDNSDGYGELLNSFLNLSPTLEYDIVLFEEDLEATDERLMDYLACQKSKLYSF